MQDVSPAGGAGDNGHVGNHPPLRGQQRRIAGLARLKRGDVVGDQRVQKRLGVGAREPHAAPIDPRIEGRPLEGLLIS